jgi:hypothetical protein
MAAKSGSYFGQLHRHVSTELQQLVNKTKENLLNPLESLHQRTESARPLVSQDNGVDALIQENGGHIQHRIRLRRVHDI